MSKPVAKMCGALMNIDVRVLCVLMAKLSSGIVGVSSGGFLSTL